MSKGMKAIGIVLALGFLILPLFGPVGAQASAKDPAASGNAPSAARHALTDRGQMQISNDDRCPVCGMFPAKRPKSAAAMVLSDGRAFYFCGNGCLLRTWRNPATYLNTPRTSIQRMVVQDYFTGTAIDAHEAWWVAGSDVVGPMGPALVALKTEKEVTQFKNRHGGKKVFQLSDMDDALWNTLFPSKKK